MGPRARLGQSARGKRSDRSRARGRECADVCGGIFRDDLQIVSYDAERCPVYTIVQQLVDGANVVFETDDEPKTYVLKEECNGM